MIFTIFKVTLAKYWLYFLHCKVYPCSLFYSSFLMDRKYVQSNSKRVYDSWSFHENGTHKKGRAKEWKQKGGKKHSVLLGLWPPLLVGYLCWTPRVWAHPPPPIFFWNKGRKSYEEMYELWLCPITFGKPKTRINGTGLFFNARCRVAQTNDFSSGQAVDRQTN